MENQRRAALIIGELGYTFAGLRFPEDIEKLGTRNLAARISTYPSSVEHWFPYPPAERRRLLDLWYKEKFDQIQAAIAPRNVKFLSRGKRKFGFFECEFSADQLSKLLAIDGIMMVTITAIEGLKPRKRREKKQFEWYIVKARFIWEVEGQTAGMQMVEDRMLMVKAYDYDDAEKRLQEEFAEYGKAWLNTDAEMVRHRLDQIIETFPVRESTIDPNGTEVFYEMTYRRMRPQYEWHPLKEDKVD